MVSIQLDWHGPFYPARFESPGIVPPWKPGLYLWTVACQEGRLISAIGEGGSLYRRIYDHLFRTLVGEYWLYEPARMQKGKGLESQYNPNEERTLFTENTTSAHRLAVSNFTAFEFYWATTENHGVAVRKSVESCLIAAVRRSKHLGVWQKPRVSVRTENAIHVVARSAVEGRASIVGLPLAAEYGMLDAF